MLDTIQIVFWSITYILIIIAGFQSSEIKKVSMPYIAGILNFGWEACALQYSKGLWGHMLWLSLDMVIVYYGFRYLLTLKSKMLYVGSIYLLILVLSYVFTLADGMLISVFVIDVIMALLFLLNRKKLSHKMKVPIAVTKLLGDAFAGLHYASELPIIRIMAVFVLLCNLIYLYLCIRERTTCLQIQYKDRKI